jgi:hypothetical protein
MAGRPQRRRSCGAISEAEQGALSSPFAASLVVMHGAMGKPGSRSYSEFGREPESLIYKNFSPFLAWIQ